MKSNTFNLSLNSGIESGAFNIYQGRNGGIYLHMSHSCTLLLRNQIDDLQLPIWNLRDFDKNGFLDFYSNDFLTKSEALCVTKTELQKGLTSLPSVGSAVDVNLMVYPVLSSGIADLQNETPLANCSENWWATLSSEDRSKIDRLKNKRTQKQ